MSHKKLYILACLIFTISLQAQNTTENIKANFHEFYAHQPIDSTEVINLLSTMIQGESWPDLDYKSTRRSNWQPLSHLKRLKTMSIAYANHSSAFYQNKELKNAIVSGFNYWCNNDFKSDNWWLGQIGVPQNIGPILILMDKEISDETKTKAFEIMDASQIGMTGQNRIWLSGNVLMRELMRENTKVYLEAANEIKQILVMTDGNSEGIQPDFSFHQHGAQLQFGNYGLHFSEDLVMWIYILNNTPLAFSPDQMELMKNVLKEGQNWVVYKNRYDILAAGRQLFPHIVDGEIYFHSIIKKAAKHKMNTKLFAEIFSDPLPASFTDTSGTLLQGFKFYPHSDFGVYRTTNFYTSVRMSSTRTIGAEAGNGENQLGYHLGDGTNLIYRRGDEYHDIYPLWDWRKLPGTTLAQDTVKLPALDWKGYHNLSDFAGGLTTDKIGIIAMKYRRDGLQANKSWYFFKGKVIAMGSDINCEETFPVETTLNQCYLKNDVFTFDKKFKTVKKDNGKTIWHDSIAYVSLTDQPIKSSLENKKGKWKDVVSWLPDTTVSATIFTASILHGTHPVDEKYAYVTIPNVDYKNIKKEASNKNISLLSLTKDIHALHMKQENLYVFTFFKSGSILIPIIGKLSVDKACLLSLQINNNKTVVTIADPSQKHKTINLTIQGNYTCINGTAQYNYSKQETSITFDLPQKIESGYTKEYLLNK
jgi:chondroitin AC lyase